MPADTFRININKSKSNKKNLNQHIAFTVHFFKFAIIHPLLKKKYV